MIQKNNINKIHEALFNRAGKVFNKVEVNSLIKEYNKKFHTKVDIENTVKYLSRHDYIKRIFLGYYYVNSLEERKRRYCKYEDKELLFTILNKSNIKWYLGLSSALYESGESWQFPVIISIINDKISGKRNILSLNVRFYKIKHDLFFGIQRGKTKNKIEYFYSNPSKTYLDFVYLRRSDKLIKNKETKKYLKYFPKWVEKK